MILDKKLNGILSQEDRALKIFEPSESDKLYEVKSCRPKVDIFLNGDQFFFFLEKLRRDIDLILFAS